MISRKDQLREAKRREREGMSEEKREKQKQAARSRMSERRAAMTIEEKEERKAKDRERKAKKGQKQKEKALEENERNEKVSNMMYKRKIRETQSKEEKELRKIENVIQVRKHRAQRTEEIIEIDKRKAKEGMKTMRKCGKIKTHCTEESKFTAGVPRKKREKDENELWKNYASKDSHQKSLFETLKPNTAAKLENKDQEKAGNTRLYDDIRKKREDKELKKIQFETPDYVMSEYELIRQKNIEDIEKMKKAIGLFDV